MKKISLILLVFLCTFQLKAQNVRERLLMDFDWKFALGHSYDTKKDFDNGTSYFSYFAKSGYGDGAASKDFDDRAWRKINLPHDWCVELPYDGRGSYSHGFKATGRNFPENSVGWYRKTITIPESDLGKRISIEFDGVHRNSIVWVNGFYLGTELSGYNSFSYDITDYLNYGGKNVIAVRVDATMEEGWYYEGAGIYRHTWLTKTAPLHVDRYGTFVTTEIKDKNAVVKVRTTIVNESTLKATFELEESIVNTEGKVIATGIKKMLTISGAATKEFITIHQLTNPTLWSTENPYLHKLKTVIKKDGKVIDQYETTFGIRTVRFDVDKGFFLNGKSVKIVGACNHQDHGGVGTAIPDALQEYRIKQLKAMGANGIRTSHNPPTPEFLEICDRLGMMVMDENRLMGVNKEHYYWMESYIKRDRNHPSIVIWSLGNEEWAIEGNITGARMAKSMYTFANKLDSSRAFTIASSGGWDWGIGTVTEMVMGINYISHGDVDGHHKKFPTQATIGTEETSTSGTRGIYESNDEKCHLAYSKNIDKTAEKGWKFYAERPYLAGLFYWTGFDYRGEPTPYGWPAVSSQFGIMDMCGFPKDVYFYLKSWWGKEPVLHVAPHWNLNGKEGKEIDITVYSNCDQVELFVNNKSIGKKDMPFNSHLKWNAIYQPGALVAVGYKAGVKILTKTIETTGEASVIQLLPEKTTIKADGEDVSIVTVQISDDKGRFVPTADNEINFKIDGPGKIIGVSNGDPSSHEAECFIETIKTSKIENLKEFSVPNLTNRSEISLGFDDSKWNAAFKNYPKDWKEYKDTLLVVRGSFELPEFTNEIIVNLFSKSILENQSIYINGKLIKADIKQNSTDQSFVLDKSLLKKGKNEYAVVGQKIRRQNEWSYPNSDPGLIQIIYPAASWKRKVFNGLAQVIVQSSKQSGDIVLTATSGNLKSEVLKIQSQKVAPRLVVE